MSARSCLPLLALVALTPAARSQDAAEAAFRARYAAAEPELIRRYAEKRRAVIQVVEYATQPATGEPRGTTEITVVSGGGRLRATGRTKWNDHPEPVRWGVWWTADAALSGTITGAGFKVERAFRGPSRHHLTEDILSNARLYLPLSSGWNGWRLRGIFDRCDYFRRLGDRRYSPRVRAEEARTPDGRPMDRVDFDAENGVRGGCYLDPTNHLALLRSDPPLGGFATAVEYGPGPEGFPVPVSFRRWAVLPDGREVPVEEGRFVVYERYTPTDDDFDLAKQFGIDPGRVKWDESPLPGAVPEKWQPQLLRRRWVWYTAAGVVAAVAAVLVALWRRRAARWWADIPLPPSPPAGP